MDNTFELIGVGSPIIDILAKVPDSFLEKVGGDKGGMVLTDGDQIAQWINELPEGSSQAPGGSAGNTVFAATRMGLQTSFIGKTGSDEGGEFYRSELQKLGGDTSRFKTGSIANGRCLSLITPDGERTLRTDLGAAATLSPDEVRPADFAGATHAHIEGYLLFNPDLMMQVLKSAKEANCRISLDLASFEVVKAAGDTLPDILNEKFPLRMIDNDLLVSELFRDPSTPSVAITALSVYLPTKTKSFHGNSIEIAYGTSTGLVRVIVQYP